VARDGNFFPHTEQFDRARGIVRGPPGECPTLSRTGHRGGDLSGTAHPPTPYRPCSNSSAANPCSACVSANPLSRASSATAAATAGATSRLNTEGMM
jgi:hypothetical protein